MDRAELPPPCAWLWLTGAGRPAAAAGGHEWGHAWDVFVSLGLYGVSLPGISTPHALSHSRGRAGATGRARVTVNWNHPAVRSYFRVTWKQSRRTGREATSRLEELWWQRVHDAFPAEDIRRHAALPETAMHLDIFWPQRRLALEVQGDPHWRAVALFGGGETLARRQERDARKRALCRVLGIRLKEVTADSPVAKTLRDIGALLGVCPVISSQRGRTETKWGYS